ncbi:MAG: DUF1566 domain-containing protein [Chromatiales bacterium]|jgi:hypothetical protein|nr:DUF1566 domain-containing protein [Chromatiales bacterium]
MRTAILVSLLLAGGSAEAALLGRAPLTPGGTDYQAFYDDLLDVTWVANANLAATGTFGVDGIAADGTMTWFTAVEWVAAMNAAAYLGQDDWRLPTVDPANGVAFQYQRSYDGSTDVGYGLGAPGSVFAGTTASELAHLNYTTLGNLAFCGPASSGNTCVPQAGGGFLNRGPFTNFVAGAYWTGRSWDPSTDLAWVFRFGPQSGFLDGNQGSSLKGGFRAVLAVRDGDLAVIPLPAAGWLLLSGLALLGRRASVRRP